MIYTVQTHIWYTKRDQLSNNNYFHPPYNSNKNNNNTAEMTPVLRASTWKTILA